MLEKEEGTDGSTTGDVQIADLNDGIVSQVQEPAGLVADECDEKSAAPDGGLIAWLQVLGSFCLYWNHW